MTILISEISNCHMGSMTKAKQLIKAAHESGADLIKGQAFVYADVAKYGSMPIEFYKQCQLNVWECEELIDYARSIGSDMFFSIFSKEFEIIESMQNYSKFSAAQTKELQTSKTKICDSDKDNIFMSVNDVNSFREKSHGYYFEKTKLMYATDYMEDDTHKVVTNVALIAEQAATYGLSDHSLGIDNCIDAVIDFDAEIIEKHFTLEKNVTFKGKIFRDTVHGATPKEFEQLAKAIK